MAVNAMAAINVPNTPKTLTVLGVEYEVVRQLGTGSYAQVFEVVRLHDGARLAAKCIDQGPLSTWARKQLVCEVEIQQSLQHPSILRMHAAGEDVATGKYVSIQDVAYGGELFERIMEQSSFVEDDARRVISQLLAAVALTPPTPTPTPTRPRPRARPCLSLSLSLGRSLCLPR
jgi:serine/threonine protein kinase